MVAGIAGLLGATLLFLFANAYWELLLARFLQGFSDACVWTLGMCLIADTFALEELGTQVKPFIPCLSMLVACYTNAYMKSTIDGQGVAVSFCWSCLR